MRNILYSLLSTASSLSLSPPEVEDNKTQQSLTYCGYALTLLHLISSHLISPPPSQPLIPLPSSSSTPLSLSHPTATEKDSIIPLPLTPRFTTHYPTPHRHQLVTAARTSRQDRIWRRHGQVWCAYRSRLTARTPRAPSGGKTGEECAAGLGWAVAYRVLSAVFEYCGCSTLLRVSWLVGQRPV